MRSWLTIGIILVITALYAIAVMIHMLLWRDKDVFFVFTRSWSRVVLFIAGIHVAVKGAEDLVPAERYVYVANHASLFDIPVILANVPDNIRIMYKRELERIPLFGWCLRMSPFIAIDRERSRDASDVLDAIVATMSHGSSVLVFPEGTRTTDGSVAAFRRGAFVLAVRSGKPIVALSLAGTSSIMPKQSSRIQGGDVAVIVGQPIHLPHSISRDDEKELMVSVREIIVNNVDLQR